MQRAIGLIVAVAAILIVVTAGVRIVRTPTPKRAAPPARLADDPRVPPPPVVVEPAPEPVAAVVRAPHAKSAIRGVVILEGDPPKRRRIKISRDLSCDSKRVEDALSEDVLVGPNGALINAVVRITKGLEAQKFAVPEEPVVLRQKDCVYVPRVIIVRVGQELQVRNEDDCLHNVHLCCEMNPESNCSQRPEQRNSWTFRAAEGPFKVACDIHPWMRAWCAVVSNPHAVVTEAGGTYAFTGLEAGEYTVECWHEKYGTRQRTVTVPEGDEVCIEFRIKP